MASYTYEEIQRMQNDAVKRAENMQKRARITVGLTDEEKKDESKNENSKPQSTSYEEPKRVPMPRDYLKELKDYGSNSSHSEGATPQKSENKNLPIMDKIKSTLKDLKIDSDKALLLSLIMLLSDEKADEVLITALIYMLT